MASVLPRPRPAPDDLVPQAMFEAREAQRSWGALPVPDRLAVVRAFRHLLPRAAGELLRASRAGQTGQKRGAEILSSEILPLAEACRFVEREAVQLLAPERLPIEGRPLWMGGIEILVRREPLGVVLILAPSNYPLFLPGAQVIQALTAGNAVLLKPGREGGAAARALAGLLATAGLPPHLLTLLPESDAAGREAIAAGPDRVLLTGSAVTGREVLADLAPALIPATLELSGCDALFLLPDCREADLDRAALALRFALTLNEGATCIAPRQVFVPRRQSAAFEERLRRLAASLPPAAVPAATARLVRELASEALAQGARRISGALGEGEPFTPLILAGVKPGLRLLRTDLFAPVLALVEVEGTADALAAAELCPYALGASIFGPEREALAFAARVRAGVVTVNDLIVPTADPRLPFGGRGWSGYGTTRGALGLLELTAVKAVAVRRGRWLPHLEEPRAGDDALFLAYLTLVHSAGWRSRLAGLRALIRCLVHRRK
ncbi:MAG TPA: aldehyde dehydrogenase family protein [Thermoanaerobaculia bacterium]|nr:aldehyde dehydrogenase family protein [Thermoanaerobaculia bacterium]